MTGTEEWSYRRDRALCTVASGFPNADGHRGLVLALYEGSTGFCSEMTALRPDTGARVAARNPDVVPGTELVADDTFVLATGERYLEVERSDLVKTLEYGAVIAPAQPGSAAAGGLRVRLQRAHRPPAGRPRALPGRHHRPAHRALPRPGRRGEAGGGLLGPAARPREPPWSR